MRHLISSEYNPVSGLTTNYYSVNGGKQIVMQVVQDAEPYLDKNTREMNCISSKGKYNQADGLGTKVASIPMGLVEQLKKEGKIDILKCTREELKRLLNDIDYKKLRTAPGKI